MPAHIHAAFIALYAQDAAETEKPWERWEFQSGGGPWCAARDTGPTWHEDSQYRRKPKTIRIGEYDVPEPMRVVPTKPFWAVSLTSTELCFLMRWEGSAQNFYLLSSGLCHFTRDAATAHAVALIAFTAASLNR